MSEKSENRKVVGFKKFSDLKEKSKVDEVNPTDIQPDSDSDIPMNPNLPKESKKTEKPASRKNIIPKDQSIELPSDNESEEELSESNVEMYGKVAKFPKGTKASKSYNFLENVKISKKSIWYIMVEKDENELQMVKYNYKEGVNLSNFVNELKTYYLSQYKGNNSICESISKISVDGNDKYSMVRGIPVLKLEGKLLITKITEDLIKLLSK